MKYFIDTEFVEGPQKENFPISLFRKETPNTIDLISIGMVSEDGREYYAISKDFNLTESWNRFQRDEQTMFEKQNGFEGRKVYWLREKVLKPIYEEFVLKENNITNSVVIINGKRFSEYNFCYSNFKRLLNKYGKTNKQIAEEVQDFCITYDSTKSVEENNPEFYAYYADYDWVVFCWLFGKMIDLPNGFPKYCSDLKQELDRKLYLKTNKKIGQLEYDFINDNTIVSCAKESYSLQERLSIIKNHPDYPKQENEHSAIDDARWNKKLYEFLKQL